MNGNKSQNNGKTTIFGFIVAAMAAANLDPMLLIHGDVHNITLLIGAICAGLWAWYTNRGTLPVSVTPTAELADKLSDQAADKAVEKISEATSNLPKGAL